MKYSFARASALGAAILGMTALSAAADNSWYASTSGQMRILEDADNNVAGVTVGSSFDNGWGLNGAVGYDFGNIRVEGELGYSTNDADDLTVFGVTLPVDGDVSALSGMANAYYDFDVGSAYSFMPYIGAGVGFARVSADISTFGVQLVDDNDTVFAYQLSAGVGYAISEQTTLFAGYRYFATSTPTFADAGGGDFDREYRSHNVMVGLRFGF